MTIMGLVPLGKIALVFALMLAGIRLRLGVGLSVTAGSLVLALLFGMGVGPWVKTSLLALTREKTLTLCAVVGLIMAFSRLMERSRQAERLLALAGERLKNPRLKLAFFPALIGLLPMPGGAVFSAPMLEAMAKRMRVRPEDKTAVNYWFRHVWEMCWPLYPGIILAATLANMSLGRLLFYACPGTLAALALGWFFLLRPKALALDAEPVNRNAPLSGSTREMLVLGLPLLTAIVGSIGLEVLVGLAFPEVPYELGVIAALALAVAVLAYQSRTRPADVLKTLADKRLAGMLFMIAGVFMFKDVLGASGAVKEVASLAGGDAALIASAVLLPVVVGLVAGITLAFVGASFPLLMGLLADLGMTAQAPAYVVLALYCGFAAVLISPMHICFLLSCEYFGADLAAAWRRIAMPSMAFALFGVLYFLVLR